MIGNNQNTKGTGTEMKQDDIQHLATMLERVAMLLKSGVSPSKLQSVIVGMGEPFRHGLHYEWERIIERLVRYYGTNFDDSTFKCGTFDINKLK